MSMDERDTDYSPDYALDSQTEYNPFEYTVELNPADLIVPKVFLAGGHFGNVYLGLLNNNGSRLPVAVKTPKSASNERMNQMSHAELQEELKLQRESLRDELRTMTKIGAHLNIIKLFGAITTSKDDFLIVTEYCENGSLDSFLRKKCDKGFFVNELTESIDADNYQRPASRRGWKREKDAKWDSQFEARRNGGKITTSDLMWFAFQISQAMEFLATNKVIHRDVALRNVLLKADLTLRLADFGLSRRLDENGSYYQTDNAALPFRYVAPEALKSGRFSVETEYWSFGVFLWELFTLAKQQPYAEDCRDGQLRNILTFLEEGKRMRVPDTAPLTIGTLMLELWNETAEERPTFNECQERLSAEIMNSCPVIYSLIEHTRAVQEYIKINKTTRNNESDYKLPSRSLFAEKPNATQEQPASIRWRRLLFGYVFFSIIVALVGIVVVIFFLPACAQCETNTEEKTEDLFTSSRRFTPVRWSWTFDFAKPPQDGTLKVIAGPNKTLDIGCSNLIWRPLLLATTADNTTTVNVETSERWTLRMELFVDVDSTGCKAVFPAPPTLSSVESMCNADTLNTDKYLFFNESCFVASNALVNYSMAWQLCNHIPGASVSRLAWVKTKSLLDKLYDVLYIQKQEQGKPIDPREFYIIGAFQATEYALKPSENPRSNWFWMNANGTKADPLPENFDLWSKGEPSDSEKQNERAAAIFALGRMGVDDIPETLERRYMCEYR
uniref:Protein kinase domain-containing protein n=1 Tax=Plectus sambesii TaxID=2011161 RepID=A0A914W8J5_9BILA